MQGLVKDDFSLNILHFFGRITFYKMKFSNKQDKVSLQVTQKKEQLGHTRNKTSRAPIIMMFFFFKIT